MDSIRRKLTTSSAWVDARGSVTSQHQLEGAVLDDAMVAGVQSSCSQDLLPLLIELWRKLSAVRKALENPNATELIPLSEHQVESVHHPAIEFLVGGLPVAKVDVDITLLLTLRGVVLVIVDGCVTEVRLGSIDGSCSLGLAGQRVWQENLGAFDLPGGLVLQPQPRRAS
jgi:hypothetical protein